jgi:hypothetical protein
MNYKTIKDVSSKTLITLLINFANNIFKHLVIPVPDREKVVRLADFDYSDLSLKVNR